MIAAAAHGLEIREYAPRRVKQAIVGRGAAGKEQVAFMVRSMLALRETPPPDAADALYHRLDPRRRARAKARRPGRDRLSKVSLG
ncbi:MAG: crossover junction endodeoxyribonuclease RuvC [Verrucomicrobiales bacterium]